jgi:hypothetical protein
MRFVLLPLMLSLSIGCGPRGASSPAEARARLAEAVAARDSAKLWRAVDQDTRWSWMTIQRAWREAYDITQSAVPEGPDRVRLLARFEPAATSEDAQTLFSKMLLADEWQQTAVLLAAADSRQPELEPSGESAQVVTTKGPLVFRKAHNRYWGWGYAGLAVRAEQIKQTAGADLERMRTNAADYERAATRGAR